MDMKTFEMHVFFEIKMYKSWEDLKPKTHFIKNKYYFTSKRDFESLQRLCLEKQRRGILVQE